MIYYPIEDAYHLIEQFNNQTLPKDEWTHEAHLMVGFYHAANYGENALLHLRNKITKLNEVHDVINSTSSGYHETITHFWLWAVQHYCSVGGVLDFNQESLDDMLWTEELANRNLWLEYYSKDLMLSSEARMSLVQPDLKELSSNSE
jgi:hypothetical protein